MNTSGTYAYTSDLADRLTRINTPAADSTLEYDAANQLQRTTDTQTGATTETFRDDQLGNRTSQDPAGPAGATTYAYDQANRLTTYTTPAASAGSPDIQRTDSYDGDGLRSDLLWDTDSSLPLALGDNDGLYITGSVRPATRTPRLRPTPRPTTTTTSPARHPGDDDLRPRRPPGPAHRHRPGRNDRRPALHPQDRRPARTQAQTAGQPARTETLS